MNRLLTASALAALLVVSASAQVSKPVGLSVRAGLIFPSSGSSRAIGNQWFGLGGEFKIKDANFGSMNKGTSSMITLSADYYGKGSASAFPLNVNYVGMTNEWYYLAGVGLTFTRDNPGGVSRNQSQFGYNLGFGYNFQHGSTPLFAEARYFGSGNSNLNALGLYIGIRI